jgi:hypothetical protein
VKRLDVAEKADDELVVAEMVDSGPQKGPTHREAEEYDENLFGVIDRFWLRHLLLPSLDHSLNNRHDIITAWAASH